MKKNMMYEAPLVEVEELMVERGFEASLQESIFDGPTYGEEDVW